MTRPTHSERLAIREQQRARRATWRAWRFSKSQPITCAICKTAKPKAACVWGNGGHKGDIPACSTACAEQLRQRKAGAA